MKDIFSSLLKQTFEKLDKIDFGQILRDFVPQQPSQRNMREHGAEWSCKDLNQQLCQLSQMGLRVTELPKSIDLSGLASVMARLNEKSKDGKEYGRIGYTRMHDGRIEMSETFSGNHRSVKMEVTYLPFSSRTPTVMMHTHPYINGRAAPSYHFSKQDFVSFLQVKPIQISLVLAPHLTLLALKTAATPEHSSILESRIDSLLERASRDFTTSSDRRIMRFTKRACNDLNIGLYRVKHSEDGVIARRVV